jgi:hypothetical protein
MIVDLLNQDRCGRRDANGRPHRRTHGTGCLIAHELLLGVADGFLAFKHARDIC